MSSWILLVDPGTVKHKKTHLNSGKNEICERSLSCEKDDEYYKILDINIFTL